MEDPSPRTHPGPSSVLGRGLGRVDTRLQSRSHDCSSTSATPTPSRPSVSGPQDRGPGSPLREIRRSRGSRVRPAGVTEVLVEEKVVDECGLFTPCSFV